MIHSHITMRFVRYTSTQCMHLYMYVKALVLGNLKPTNSTHSKNLEHIEQYDNTKLYCPDHFILKHCELLEISCFQLTSYGGISSVS
jgi:hypothetical protein